MCELSWDQNLEGELLLKWQALVDDVAEGRPLVLPRYYLNGWSVDSETSKYRLFGFCDASTMAYAAVIYLVKENETRKLSSFVAAKTRVAPLKTPDWSYCLPYYYPD